MNIWHLPEALNLEDPEETKAWTQRRKTKGVPKVGLAARWRPEEGERAQPEAAKVSGVTRSGSPEEERDPQGTLAVRKSRKLEKKHHLL